MRYFKQIIAGLAIVAAIGCEHGKSAPAASTGQPAEVPSTTDSAVDAEPELPELAATPRIDLASNRFRWHIFREGLVVPFASEGLRKYSQEYSRPFGDLVKVGDHEGRVLGSPGATLRVPLHDSKAAVLKFYAHGLAEGQRVSVDINGKSAGSFDLPNAWSEVELPVDSGLFVKGENDVRLKPRSAGRAGGAKSYGLWYALEIAPASGKAGFPSVSPGEGSNLDGSPAMEMYLEVPAQGWLLVETAKAATVSATLEDGSERELLRSDAGGEHRVSLADLAGKLIRLRFESAGEWRGPTIAMNAAPTRDVPKFQNVILLVVDALRSDRLSLYGDTRVRTPRIDAAAGHGAVFLHNQSASPSSPPSHASIQTGMIPRVHGVVGDKGQLDSGVELISTHLGKAGFATAYVGNNSFGMSRLQKAAQWTKSSSPISEGKGQDCDQVIEGVLAFATAQHKAGKRFFISALPIETHAPYRFHEGVSEHYHQGEWKPPIGKNVSGHRLEDIVGGRVKMDDSQWSQLRALYDGEVEHMDQCFGALEDGLAALGIASETAIVLTSDHGEGMGERDRMGHAYGLFGELSNVPFVVFAPGLSGPVKIPTVTGHVDIAPTVLQLAGVDVDPAIQGESMLPLIERQGDWTPRVTSLEYGRSYALRSARWKLFVDYGGKESLFDSTSDPLDQNDVADAHPFAMRYMRDASGFFLEHRSNWRAATWGSLNDHRAGAFQ